MNHLISFIMIAVLFVTTTTIFVHAHIEDICVTPPGPCLKCGIYNFYTIASKLGCRYLEEDPKCVTATLIAQSKGGFNDTSNCRGIIHFNAIYFIAVALGFKPDIAYNMASFSQAIDFAQYKGVDSCGKAMDKGYWTPPMRGLLRTQRTFGGTNRHLGVPYVGLYDNITVVPSNLNTTDLNREPLFQFDKIYTGNLKKPNVRGCQKKEFTMSNRYYEETCPGLMPDFNDFFYEGALASAKKWAFGETDLLCIAGFTKENPITGSLFTGTECPDKGAQFQVNIGSIVQGPIPITGPPMALGEQVMQFECTPNCTAETYEIVPESIVYASQLKQYLQKQATENGYAVLNDPPGAVPEIVARFGIFLHWVADRASHWYCCDASSSGVKAVKQGDHYNLFLYLSKSACNFINHGMVHYVSHTVSCKLFLTELTIIYKKSKWEQGVSELAPGSYYALVNTYKLVLEFRNKYIQSNPEWFRPGAKVLSLHQIVGNKANPGILYKITNIPNAVERFHAEVQALKEYNLPPMPGFETMCKQNRTSSLRENLINKINNIIIENTYDDEGS
jgi:hypothetical protein